MKAFTERRPKVIGAIAVAVIAVRLLLRDQGLRFDYLHGRYRREFIHYGAFSKNTSVTRETVALFRWFALLEYALPWRLAQLVRRMRGLVLPRLENNRYQWVREAPIRW